MKFRLCSDWPRSVFVAGLLSLAVTPALGAGTDCVDAVSEDCAAWVVETAYTADLLRNASGGLQRGNAYLDGFDAIVSLDAARAFGWSGVRFHGHIQYNNGAEFSARRVGDNQSVSNIEGFATWRVYELWAEKAFDAADHARTVRFGLYDLNSEFDSIDTAGLFLNASHGIGPEFAQSGLNGPSIFPVTSLAVRVRGERERGYWQIAALDAVPGDRDDPERSGVHLDGQEGALLVAEWGMARGRLKKLAVGAWSYTGRFDSLAETDALTGAATRARGNRGAYLLVDSVLRETEVRRVDAFARVGLARERFNGVGDYIGAGIVVSAPLRARPEDQLGLGVASAGTGGDYRRAASLAGSPAQRRETAWELTYRAPLTDWMTVQPNLQYVRNPGFDPALADAWVLGLRLELATAWLH